MLETKFLARVAKLSVVALFFLVVQLAARPFQLREDTHFALLASTALVVGLVCCVALQLDDVVRDLWVNLSSKLKKRFALQCTAASHATRCKFAPYSLKKARKIIYSLSFRAFV